MIRAEPNYLYEAKGNKFNKWQRRQFRNSAEASRLPEVVFRETKKKKWIAEIEKVLSRSKRRDEDGFVLFFWEIPQGSFPFDFVFFNLQGEVGGFDKSDVVQRFLVFESFRTSVSCLRR